MKSSQMTWKAETGNYKNNRNYANENQFGYLEKSWGPLEICCRSDSNEKPSV